MQGVQEQLSRLKNNPYSGKKRTRTEYKPAVINK
jgi:hypothetical protein